jgi:hypothetical protein
MTGIADRREDRRRRMVVNRAVDFQAAEDWDLDFWLSQTPQQRLSALVAIREDILKVTRSRTPRRESRSRQ